MPANTPSIHFGLLAAPSLTHLREAPALASTLSRTVEECQRSGCRFPHTLLVGPSDSGKRGLVSTIAAELAVPVIAVDATIIGSSDDLHAAFRRALDGSIVVISGMEGALPAMLRDIARAAARNRLSGTGGARPTFPGTPGNWGTPNFKGMAGIPGFPGIGGFSTDEPDPRARASRRYEDFTIILTSRSPIPVDSGHCNWIERTFYLTRTQASEAVRLERVLQRAGLNIDAAGAASLGRCVSDFGLRTLTCASLVAEWMRSNGLTTVTHDVIEPEISRILECSIDPVRAAEIFRQQATELTAGREESASAVDPQPNQLTSNRQGIA
ncbi:MAG: hypothetical protein RIR77_2102 [Planctomycetota bacterium]